MHNLPTPPPHVRFAWGPFPADGQEGPDGYGRGQILDSGDLLVPAVRRSDQGKYTCTRSNEAGSVSASGYLAVLGT